MQQSLFDSANDNMPIVLDMPDANVIYYPNFISPMRAEFFYQALMSKVDWQQDHINMYGKTHKIPRLQAWYGDPVAAYAYSGLTMQPKPWLIELHKLRNICQNIAGSQFNSVLANLYRDGNDGVGRHADNEPELGDEPVIASLSFGATRNLDFYHNNGQNKLRLPLESGSLLLMKGQTQSRWQHGVAKTKWIVGARINLTFRSIKKNPDF